MLIFLRKNEQQDFKNGYVTLIAVLFLLLLFCNFSYSIELFSVPVVTYGKVKFDSIFDSRQFPRLFSTQDVVFLYPSPVDESANGRDINAFPRYNIALLESRIGFKVEDYPINDRAVLTAKIENDFIGAAGFIGTYPLLSLIQPFPDSLRMRVCYINVDWDDQHSVLAGHYWHMLSPIECKPETVSCNAGAPIELENRETQVRYVRRIGSFELSLAAHEQMDFVSTGPAGPNPNYIRNAIVPDVAAKFKYYFGCDSSTGLIVDYKRLIPQINFETNHKGSINGFIGALFLNLKKEYCELKIKLIYEDNASEFGSLGAYAVKTQNAEGDQTYRNVPAIAAWLEYIHNFTEQYQFGFFTGGSKRIGAHGPLFIEPLTGQPFIFGLNPNLEYVYRVSPRMKYISGPTEVGLELELTGAGSGTNLNQFGNVINPDLVNNFRILLALSYYF